MTAPEKDRDVEWMEQALVEAKKGWPSPNPHVGVVIVKDGAIIARGHHERAGDDHAEVAALKAAGPAAAGATLYATLEPCNHHGRTPPCTEAIVTAGIGRVVIGCADPNPHVEGGGAARLAAAGIAVTVGVLEDQAARTIRAFTKHVTSGMPYVSVKLALSLDGRIATRTGASKWVTGPLARAKVHALRGEHDGVAVGIGTALADDPRLTVRDAPGRSPLRIVFDTRLRLPLSSRLVTTASAHPVCVLCTDVASPEAEEALIARGVHVVRAARSTDGRVDVAAGLMEVAKLGVVRLMVEGGAELAGSFLASQLADELHAFLAPLLLGPRGRPGAVDWAGPATLAEAPRIESPRWELVGEDAYVHGRIAYPT